MAKNTSPAFASRLGFILAAAGSAVGVGNIWGFPTQAASNGGGAFLLVYLIMIAILAYPMLVACVFRSIRTAIPASFGQAFRCHPDKLIFTSHDFLFT